MPVASFLKAVIRKGASSKILFFLYLNFSKMFVAIKGKR